jgi:hypothetical protein
MQRLKRLFAMPQVTLSRCCASIHLVEIETCPDCGGQLRVIASTRDGFVLALLARADGVPEALLRLRRNRTPFTACSAGKPPKHSRHR